MDTVSQPQNGYICLLGTHRAEVYAETSYAAQQLALQEFKTKFPRRRIVGHQITVILAERAGETILQTLT